MKYLLIFLGLIFSKISICQTISGKIISANGKPIEFATVSCKSDSTIMALTASDKSGNFKIEKLNNYQDIHVVITLIGYKKKDTLITNFNNNNIYLNIILTERTTQLKEVTVNTRKNLIERKIDRLVFNVENNVITVGSDGLDILSQTPLVRVDGNNVSLVGKGGVDVMINNRLTHLSGDALASLLKSLNATNISKIEVITNPPSEYEAQGNSGLINIITKKNTRQGYSGSFNSTLSKATYTTLSESLNLNYNIGNLLTFGSLGIANGAGGPTNFQNRFYQLQTWNEQYRIKEQSKYVDLTLGFDYILSKKTTIGASFENFKSHPNVTGMDNTLIQNNVSQKIDSILNVTLSNGKAFTTRTANLHVSQKIDTTGKEFTFDADYFSNQSNIANNSVNKNTLANGSLTDNPVTNIFSDNNLISDGYTLNVVFNGNVVKNGW